MKHSRVMKQFDRYVIVHIRSISMPLARIALFVIFFWFGALKLVYVSPANPMVSDLLHRTLPFLTFAHFIFVLGLWEMAIGICFLVPRMERLAIALLLPHMVTTFMPLVLLPALTWQGFLIPTLEGQYIIKNLVIIALALAVAAQMQPWMAERKQKSR